ncbi:putative inorganic phosphate transporter 1-3 [Dichanthelium oligosanthes]|uniref:H(+)/Pi cotransporter n=1 Tax=Dichanthelium oligosanthes TaxID=888268 RepID=A0A1E5ULM9_9POAL|nr:putative inorganic phosphate transporter 1-3 [Dichanthelium oligosanthes]
MARPHQLNVLATLDRARTQRYHLAAAAIAGTGCLAAAYNQLNLAFLLKLIGRVYYAETATPGKLPDDAAFALFGATYCGTFVGHLAFGLLGDRIGRRRTYGLTLALMAVFSAASGLSFGRTAKAVLATLCFFRFWLCVGVGGSSPLSVTIIAEYANKRTRGIFIAAVHAMEGAGILLAYTVALGVSSVVPEADYLWRAIFVAGAVPAALAFYLRTKLPETARYTALVARDPKRAAADMSLVLCTSIQEQELNVSIGRVDDEWGLFSVQFMKRHGLQLLATTSARFLLGVTYYSQIIILNVLFAKHEWVHHYSPAASMGAVQEVASVAGALALIALCGDIPGYILSVVLIDVLGRRRLLLGGFAVMTLSMLVLATLYDYWTSHAAGFVALYNLAFFFGSVGPRTTTFVAPVELFPARLRCTCHGIAMAAGRAGAVLGIFGFLSKGADRYTSAIGTRNELFVLAGTNFLGMLMSLFIPETRGASLEFIRLVKP